MVSIVHEDRGRLGRVKLTAAPARLATGKFHANGLSGISMCWKYPLLAACGAFAIALCGEPNIASAQTAGCFGNLTEGLTVDIFCGQTFVGEVPLPIPDAAVNAGAVYNFLDTIHGISDDAIEADLGLSPAAAVVQFTPDFAVFASGQFAHTYHDGYTVSGNGLVGPGPSFGVDDFSAAISLDFNAGHYFQFDPQYGLNLGLFAGYASTNVHLHDLFGVSGFGNGLNESGMFGGYALLRSGYNYALVAASGFLGNADVYNGILDASGGYDTRGYAVTASVGHIFTLSEHAKFDLRGGILGVSFRGDPYTDSQGFDHGEGRLSFGAVRFEPGIYADYKLANGKVISPYVRAELQERFSYRNTVVFEDDLYRFDDADFSAALSTGFNLKMSAKATLSAEVRGKLSSDSSQIGGKIGLKIAF